MVTKKEPSIFRKRKKTIEPTIPKKRKITAKRRKLDTRAPPIEKSEGYCSTEPKTVVIEFDRHFNIISRKVLDTTTNKLINLI